MTFNPASATGDDQKVLNIFYYCCYMHDFSYLLGFREADGNFQPTTSAAVASRATPWTRSPLRRRFRHRQHVARRRTGRAP